jgi:hypothetical protein
MRFLFKAALLIFLMALSVDFTFLTGQSSAQVLLQQSAFVYQGAFRLPLGDFGSPQGSGFNYGGTGLAYNPNRNSLFLVGHDWYQLTAEVSIPNVVNSTSLNSLATASVLQNFTDALEGKISDINAQSPKVGAQLIYNDQLYVAAWSSYDGAATQDKSQFVRPTGLSVTGQVKGPYKVGTLYPGWVDHYATPIPSEWQSAFGGPVLTGGCCAAIVGLQSLGPSTSVFNPSDVGVKDPVPATLLLGYSIDHPTLGTWGGDGQPNPIYNMKTNVGGIVFPQGTRSVLFFGSTGLGVACYGTGAECNDPADGSKGTHAYPYSAYVWAYDANDLLVVKNGQKNPWDVRPYATWTIDAIGYSVGGAAYDPATRRIYISVGFGDGTMPVIHVFKVNVGDSTPPVAPTNLRIR